MASFCFTTEGHQLVPKTISLYVSQNIMTQAAGGSVVVECENVGVGDLGGGGGGLPYGKGRYVSRLA